MKSKLTLIPSVAIHPQQINFYYEQHWEPVRPARKDTNSDYFAFVKDDGTLIETKGKKYEHLLESDRKANGKVSKTARKKMTRAIDYLMVITTEKKIVNRITGRNLFMKVAFITLTLPSAQIHPDTEIINTCLNQFLIEIKKYYKVKNYVWRAEKQKNANIHFHILIDKFIDYQELRDRWNRIVEKLGYVTRYREEQKNWHKNGFQVRKELLKTWPEEKQKQAYLRGAKNHWNSPNSTDIHSLKNIINIRNYITKYLTKNEQSQEETQKTEKTEQTQTGRIWGCNRELSNIKGAQLNVDSITEENLRKLDNNPAIYRFEATYFKTYYINYKKLPEIGCQHLFDEITRYLSTTFGTPYQFSTTPP